MSQLACGHVHYEASDDISAEYTRHEQERIVIPTVANHGKHPRSLQTNSFSARVVIVSKRDRKQVITTTTFNLVRLNWISGTSSYSSKWTTK